ncbi:MAG: phytoene/squalene synthase family protein [Planctomycetota bacterium]
MDIESEDCAQAVGASSLARHSSTFHAAHRLLGEQVGEDVELLYGFCRYVDDSVDEQPIPAAEAALAQLRMELRAQRSSVPEVCGFFQLGRQHQIDPLVTEAFLAGFEEDLAPRAYRTTAELLRYCYRVAGTVGLLMCSLLDVAQEEAYPFAIDLGIGMQLTNICRDVREDASRGRVYLPADLTNGPLDSDFLRLGRMRDEQRARAAIGDLLALAGEYYRSGEAGLGYLPARPRAAVAVAARCYEAIGDRVLSAPEGCVPERVFVSGRTKAFLALKLALPFTRAAVRTTMRRDACRVTHREELHAALAGLPGANPKLCS